MKNIVIVSDSKVAVAWVNGIGTISSDCDFATNEIRSFLSLLGSTSVVFNSRASNTLADSLAKKGSGLNENVLIWDFRLFALLSVLVFCVCVAGLFLCSFGFWCRPVAQNVVAGEKVYSNFSRTVVVLWLFVVFVLTSSYTDSLSSLLTVQQLQPNVTDINFLKHNNLNVGCDNDS
ncbi:hypothetical protein Q3G72_026062 [Acer saccharum]|nr:hypothetical protein Q3G72_026062 [Acer saccharum]